MSSCSVRIYQHFKGIGVSQNQRISLRPSASPFLVLTFATEEAHRILTVDADDYRFCEIFLASPIYESGRV